MQWSGNERNLVTTISVEFVRHLQHPEGYDRTGISGETIHETRPRRSTFGSRSPGIEAVKPKAASRSWLDAVL